MIDEFAVQRGLIIKAVKEFVVDVKLGLVQRNRESTIIYRVGN
jgi:hypothetical protein